MILRLLIKASGQIHDIYGGVHMHMGHSHSAIVIHIRVMGYA